MTKNVTDKTLVVKNTYINKKNIKCHYISNTHWDREWRFSAQRTRYMLVYMLDMLLDILDKDENFKHFHLDSQTIPVNDYLEIRPENKEKFKTYVKDGKIAIGPWFVLPDEFCVSGESLIRNLLLGHKIAKDFGSVSKTGYSPFSWGQISQMPQIYKDFGIDMIAFYRGINIKQSPNSEFFWIGPDGSKIIGSRLAARPRYNVWYIIQRPAYWNVEDENARILSWKDGHAPFKSIDLQNKDLEYRFAHPKYSYHKNTISSRSKQAIFEQDKDWTTNHRFWSAGHDSSCPDIRETQIINDCNEALDDNIEVFHSTVKDFQDGVVQNVKDDLPELQGEMRHPFILGSSSTLMGWIISARIYIKQANFLTEIDIINYAEPMAVFASMLGAPYPQRFIDLAYHYLLENHGHDSIGGCSRDIVHEDMLFRYRQSREISSCIIERSLVDISGSINLSSIIDENGMAIVVFNPASFKRSETTQVLIDAPSEWESDTLIIEDESGNKLDFQLLEKLENSYHIAQNPIDVANMYKATRYNMIVRFKDIPAMGYKTYKVTSVEKSKLQNPKTMLTRPYTMENKYLSVTINSNGTIKLVDKMNNQIYNDLGYFRDTSEIGNPWEHVPVVNNTMFTTLNENAEVILLKDGALETSYQVKINWQIPEGRSKDEKSRSNHLVSIPIINTITLKKDYKRVDITTELINNAEDHYLQVSFPTTIDTDHVMVQGQFDVLKRYIQKEDYSQYDETPQTEEPMNSFIDISNDKKGITLLNEGLKAYEAHDDPSTTISLTLLRAYPLRICLTNEMTDYSHLDKGSQCLGRHKYKYGIMVHSGNWEDSNVWQESERFNLPFKAAQIGYHDHGTESLTKSFLEIKPDNLVISAVKRSENNNGWIVRLFNPFNKTINGSLRLNNGNKPPSIVQSPVERVQNEFKLPEASHIGWLNVDKTNLEEIITENLTVNKDGWISFEITKKKILSILFS